jgi:hypothetical protein
MPLGRVAALQSRIVAAYKAVWSASVVGGRDKRAAPAGTWGEFHASSVPYGQFCNDL